MCLCSCKKYTLKISHFKSSSYLPLNFVNFLKTGLIFNIFNCFWMLLNKLYTYLTCAYLKKFFDLKSWTCHFQIKAKILADFEIWTRNAIRCNNRDDLLHLRFTLKIWKSEDLWWSLYCENKKPLKVYLQKSSTVDACMGSKYTSAFWRLFKCFTFLKDFSL